MEMIDQRIVHVTGSTIEPYDVRIGEGVMGQLAQVLGSMPRQSDPVSPPPMITTCLPSVKDLTGITDEKSLLKSYDKRTQWSVKRAASMGVHVRELGRE